MKTYDAVISTTHIDSHGDRMSRDALEDLVRTISSSYIPIGIEHDPRVPPQGRIASAIVRDRSDGESEVVAVFELFDDEEHSPEENEDKREIVLRIHQEGKLTISHGWTHRSEEDQADIKAIAEILGSDPIYEVKKAADPISIIIIGGAFVLGGIAAGFLGQIGSDAWGTVKEKLVRLTSKTKHRKGEQLVLFTAVHERHGVIVEIEAILTDPDPQALEDFIFNGLSLLDRVVPFYLDNSPDIRRLVFEVNGDELQLSFAVRKDCRPVAPTVRVIDILAGDESD